MIYNAEKDFDVQRAIERFRFLVKNKKRFELKEKKPIRSLPQNSYLHLILSWYALEYGETLEYVKQEIFKKQVNKEIFKFEFINRITSEVRIEYRSTAALDTREMTMAIERFRNFSVQQAGIYLPEPNDLVFLQEIQDEINKHESLLYI